MTFSDAPRSTQGNADGAGGEDATSPVAGDGTLALECDGLAKTFVGRTVLHPFRLTVAPGEIHALLGQNGSGKSTLIKILSGLHHPDSPAAVCRVGGRQLAFGDSLSAHSLGLRFVHQDLGLVLQSSIADNLGFTQGYPTRFGAIRRSVATERARRMLETVELDLDPSTLVSSLTNAQRTGVAVARAMGLDTTSARVLVLDEPTATLPENDVAHLHATLRAAAASGVGILYVTHHLDEVFSLATTVSVLRDGHLVHSGPVAATDRPAIVRHLIGRELEEVARTGTAAGDTSATRPIALDVRDLQDDIIRGISLTVRAGEIVGIYGLVGSGSESVLGAIYGARARTGGTVTVGSTVVEPYRPKASRSAGVAYVPPDRKVSGGFMHLTAAENITLADLRTVWHKGFLRLRRERREAAGWFDSLQVHPRDGVDAQLATFSGGNQQKIVFGKWLRTDPVVLLLDEPTQGVDVGAKAELHRRIIRSCADGLAVVVSSTDVEELATLCDRVLFIVGGRIAGEMSGGGFTDVAINHRFHEIQSSASRGVRS